MQRLLSLVENNDLEAIKTLIQKEKLENDALKKQNCYIEDALIQAVTNEQVPIVEYLLEEGAYIKPQNLSLIYQNFDFLALAAEKQNIPIIKAFLKRHASIHDALHSVKEKFGMKSHKYSSIVKILLDFAQGIDFDSETQGVYSYETYGGLSFLKGLDVSDFNFLGISVNGVPVTRDMLKQNELLGAEKALVTEDDYQKLQDQPRCQLLTTRLNDQIEIRGMLKDDAGVINLVPLWRACEIGDTQAIKARLSVASTNVNESCDNENSLEIPIKCAAINGHVDAIKLLVEHANNFKHLLSATLNIALNENLPSNEGLPYDLLNIIADYFYLDAKSIVNAIHSASEKNHRHVVSYLSTLIDIDTIDEYGDTLLNLAMKKPDIERVKELINLGSNVNHYNIHKKTPLHLAATMMGNEGAELVKLLLENKADPNQYKYTSPLEIAIQKNNFESTKLLLPVTNKKEIIVTNYDGKEIRRDPWYRDIMFDALEVESIEMLTLLKDAGADFNTRDQYGRSLLDRVIHKFPRLESLKAEMDRLKSGGYFQYGSGFPGSIETNKRLITEASNDFKEVFKLFNFIVEQGFNLKAVDENNNSALHCLITNSEMSHIAEEYQLLLQYLLEHEVDVNAKNNDGVSPLHAVIHKKDKLAITFLMNEGANLEATNNNMQTPLHFAASMCSTEMVEILLNLGANINARDKDNLTPLELSNVSYLQMKEHTLMDIFKKQCDEYYRATKKLLLSASNKPAVTELVRQREALFGNVTSQDSTIQPTISAESQTNKPN